MIDPNSFGMNFRIQAPTFEENKMVFKAGVRMAKDLNDMCVKVIVEAAKKKGITDLILLNEKTIISALEKQIPKKVIKHGFDPNALISSVHYTCPNCNKHVSKTKHCTECGQALDWGETE